MIPGRCLVEGAELCVEPLCWDRQSEHTLELDNNTNERDHKTRNNNRRHYKKNYQNNA